MVHQCANEQIPYQVRAILGEDYSTAAALSDLYNLDLVFQPPVNFYSNFYHPYHDIDVKINRFVPALKSFETEIENSVIEELEGGNLTNELANSSVPDPSISVSLTPHPKAKVIMSSKDDTAKSSVGTFKLQEKIEKDG